MAKDLSKTRAIGKVVELDYVKNRVIIELEKGFKSNEWYRHPGRVELVEL